MLSYADCWRQSLCFHLAKHPTFSAISALLAETQSSLILIPHLVRWTKNLLTDISLSVKKMQFTQNIDTLLKWEHMLIIMWSLLEIIDNRKAIIFNVLLRLWNDNHCTKGPKMIDGLSFGAYTWHKLLDIYPPPLIFSSKKTEWHRKHPTILFLEKVWVTKFLRSFQIYWKK